MILFETEPFGLKKTLSTISGGHGGDWLQFWGTYLGIIFSVVLTLYVTNKQGQIDRKNARNIHALEIYIDNLMSVLDILNKLQPLEHRCQIYHKKVLSGEVSIKTLYEERNLLVTEINDEQKNRVIKLKNTIKKMPLKSKTILENPIHQLGLVIVSFRVEPETIDLDEECSKLVKVFISNYNLINEFITIEIDKYNKIE